MNPELSISGAGGDLEFRVSTVRYTSGDRWELNVIADGDYNFISTTLYMDDAIRLRDWLAQVIAHAQPKGSGGVGQ